MLGIAYTLNLSRASNRIHLKHWLLQLNSIREWGKQSKRMNEWQKDGGKNVFMRLSLCYLCTQRTYCCSIYYTFSSKALWCSNRLLSAFNTSTSLETPLWAAACRFTTVIRSDRSCRDTKHSRCSRSSWKKQSKHQNKNHSLNFTLIISSIEQSVLLMFATITCTVFVWFRALTMHTHRAAVAQMQMTSSFLSWINISIGATMTYFSIRFKGTEEHRWTTVAAAAATTPAPAAVSTTTTTQNEWMCNQICCLN